MPRRIEGDSSIRGVLIRSAKPAGFCAGADLKTIQTCTSAAELAAYLRRGMEVLDRLAGLKVPTTAVVHGVCLGGGLELALACRCRAALASSVALQMGSPEVQLGLIPAWGAMVRLARFIAPRDALNLVLTGNPIGFLQAKSQGLVDRLVAQDEQDRIAETLRARAPTRSFRWTGQCGVKNWSSQRPRRKTSPPIFPRPSKKSCSSSRLIWTRDPKPPWPPPSNGAPSWACFRSPGMPSPFLPAAHGVRPEANSRLNGLHPARSTIVAVGQLRLDHVSSQVEPAPAVIEDRTVGRGDDLLGALEHRVGVIHQLHGPVPA